MRLQEAGDAQQGHDGQVEGYGSPHHPLKPGCTYRIRGWVAVRLVGAGHGGWLLPERKKRPSQFEIKNYGTGYNNEEAMAENAATVATSERFTTK